MTDKELTNELLGELVTALNNLSEHFTGATASGDVITYITLTLLESGTTLYLRRDAIVGWHSAVESSLIISDDGRPYYHRDRRLTRILLAGHTEWMNVREREPEVARRIEDLANHAELIAQEDKEDADYNAEQKRRAEAGED